MSEYVPEARHGGYFHGEDWYRCPHCGEAFEFYEAQYEDRGIKKTEKKDVFICGRCGKKYSIR